MGTKLINKSDWVGTKSQYAALTEIESNRKYHIVDMPIHTITNADMALALTSEASLYKAGDIFLCSDSGTYSQNAYYKYSIDADGPTWTLTTLSGYATLSGSQTFSGAKTFSGATYFNNQLTAQDGISTDNLRFLRFTCSTAAATTAKVVSMSNTATTFSLTSGQIIEVTFTYANSAACTLNVDGTGAKTCYRAQGATKTAAPNWSAGDVVRFQYDGSYWRQLTYYGLSSVPNAYYAYSATSADKTDAALTLQSSATGTVTFNGSTARTLSTYYMDRFTDQTIDGKKTFSDIQVSNDIIYNSSGEALTLPSMAGTLATLDDINNSSSSGNVISNKTQSKGHRKADDGFIINWINYTATEDGEVELTWDAAFTSAPMAVWRTNGGTSGDGTNIKNLTTYNWTATGCTIYAFAEDTPSTIVAIGW